MTRRLRFSIRTLVIFITLICCYAACWGPIRAAGSYKLDLRKKRHIPARSGGVSWAFNS